MSHLKYMTDRSPNDEEPTLSEMAEAAVTRLKLSKSGFVLLVEGGRIDHGHHDNYAKRSMVETIEFENAVKVGSDLPLLISNNNVMNTSTTHRKCWIWLTLKKPCW